MWTEMISDMCQKTLKRIFTRCDKSESCRGWLARPLATGAEGTSSKTGCVWVVVTRFIEFSCHLAGRIEFNYNSNNSSPAFWHNSLVFFLYSFIFSFYGKHSLDIYTNILTWSNTTYAYPTDNQKVLDGSVQFNKIQNGPIFRQRKVEVAVWLLENVGTCNQAQQISYTHYSLRCGWSVLLGDYSLNLKLQNAIDIHCKQETVHHNIPYTVSHTWIRIEKFGRSEIQKYFNGLLSVRVNSKSTRKLIFVMTSDTSDPSF